MKPRSFVMNIFFCKFAMIIGRLEEAARDPAASQNATLELEVGRSKMELKKKALDLIGFHPYRWAIVMAQVSRSVDGIRPT